MTSADATGSAHVAEPLTYASPTHRSPLVWLFRIAAACWIAPLAVGLATLGLYALTYASALPIIGFFTLLGGVGCLFIGLVCIVAFWVNLRRCAPDVHRIWSRRSLILLFLLLANLPIAFVCAYGGTWLINRLTIIAVNDGSAAVEDLVVNVAGDPVQFDTLGPGTQLRRTVTIGGEGGVTFTARRNDKIVTGDANVYLSPPASDIHRITVRFSDSGASATAK